VGAFQPDTREVDDQVINRALIVVDTYKGAFREAGDLLIPLRQGIITRGHIVADLHEIVSGKKPARRNGQEITVFKSVGCAFEDLVIAKFIYDDFQRGNGAP
jgi:ornithine cyclodeaminase